MVAVDILSEKGHLPHATRGKCTRLDEHIGGGPGGLGTPRIGHDAEGAELVTAFLNGHERRGVVGRYPCLRKVIELALGRKIRVQHSARGTASARNHFRETMIGLRSEYDVDEWGSFQHRLTFGLRDTASHSKDDAPAVSFRPVFQPPQLPELGVNLLGRFFTYVARIEDDHVGVVRMVHRHITKRRQHVRHTSGVVHVHLASVGLDIKVLRQRRAGRWQARKQS